MKFHFLILLCFFPASLFSQSFQLQYDLRHSIDPVNNKSNYPSLFYEYFKLFDNGGFFTKIQSDFYGERNNIGQLYLQIFGEIKFWDPLILLHLEYNGGIGIVEGTNYGYYINNAFLIGTAFPFQWEDDWQSASLCYGFNAYDKPSHDVQFSFFWSKNLYENKFSFSGNFVLFTQNKNPGDNLRMSLTGKEIKFWGQPQIWFNATNNFSAGTQVSLYYNVYSYAESLLIYPAVSVKYRF